ncbi:DUF4235 domain-containing protein [Actinocrispum sp. NPDC049592]|uniref:DUF4235 domain-containing protein n=1 Tax=Actinocrispum sp. NPDC049592 TaxID=3154835 RepID=UPI003440A4AC
MLRLLYRPLGLLFGVLGGLLANAVFSSVWKRLTGDADAPNATDQDRGWREVLAAATIQGAVFGLVKAAVDRGGAAGFRKATGEWPGDKSSKTGD